MNYFIFYIYTVTYIILYHIIDINNNLLMGGTVTEFLYLYYYC